MTAARDSLISRDRPLEITEDGWFTERAREFEAMDHLDTAQAAS